MRFLFLDESGKIEDGRLFALGGIAVRDTDWAPLRDLWQGTLHEAGRPLDREVKWHGIRGPSHHSATGELEGVGLKRFPEAVPRPHGEGRLFGVEGVRAPAADGDSQA